MISSARAWANSLADRFSDRPVIDRGTGVVDTVRRCWKHSPIK
jgi:hypothetical protein